MSSNGTIVAPTQGTEQQAPQPTRINGQSLLVKMGERFGVDGDKMMGTLKATAFRQKQKDGKPSAEVTTEQMMALLIVADQYHLNPWTREIYAFPQDGGIVPIVGVDGWIRMMNEHPQFDGVEFDYGPVLTNKDEQDRIVGAPYCEWVECRIFRKDRARPTIVREYYVECYRPTIPWKDMPRRQLRHKALIQSNRVAFGFAGIYDEEEAEAVIEAKSFAPSEPALPPTGRVHHNRIAKLLPPAEEDAPQQPSSQQQQQTSQQAAPTSQPPAPQQQPAPVSDEREIKRQELIGWLNDQLNQERPSSRVLDEVGRSLRENAAWLGPDIVADMQRRFQAKTGAVEEAFAPVRRGRIF